MSITGAIVVFISLWFLSVLVLLPIGHQGESGSLEQGMPSGVPKSPKLLLKMGVALVLSSALSIVVYFIVSNQWITLDQISKLWGLEQPSW